MVLERAEGISRNRRNGVGQLGRDCRLSLPPARFAERKKKVYFICSLSCSISTAHLGISRRLSQRQAVKWHMNITALAPTSSRGRIMQLFCSRRGASTPKTKGTNYLTYFHRQQKSRVAGVSLFILPYEYTWQTNFLPCPEL